MLILMGAAGIIVGSGAGNLEPFRAWERLNVDTPFGSVELWQGEVATRMVYLTPRHGEGHVVPPHLINYRAMISALAEVGVDRVIGTAAVGSLSTSSAPGTAAVLTDFIDFTRRGPITFFDASALKIVHIDFSEPYCPEVSAALLNACEANGFEVTTPCTYLCADGPRYETPAEISMFRKWGADVVGMTNAPEAILCREKGLCYGAIAIITNFAAGISPTPLSHSEVIAVMKSIEGKLAATLIDAVKELPANCSCKCRPRAI